MSSTSKKPKSEMQNKAVSEAENLLAEFEAARARYNAFARKHVKILDELNQHIRETNEANKAVRAHYKKHHEELGETLGDFKIQRARELDVVTLLDLVPELVEKAEYTMKMPVYDAAVENGLVPEEVQEAVETTIVKIQGPKEL